MTVTVPPESSTADGSVQVAGADVAPAGAVTDTPAGQSLTTGGVLSTGPPSPGKENSKLLIEQQFCLTLKKRVNLSQFSLTTKGLYSHTYWSR